MVMFIHGTYKVKYHPNGRDTEPVYEVDFTPPFKRVDMYQGLTEALGTKLPDPKTLHTEGFFLFEILFNYSTLQKLDKNLIASVGKRMLTARSHAQPQDYWTSL